MAAAHQRIQKGCCEVGDGAWQQACRVEKVRGHGRVRPAGEAAGEAAPRVRDRRTSLRRWCAARARHLFLHAGGGGRLRLRPLHITGVRI